MTDLSDQMRTCAAQLYTIEVSEILTDPQMEAIIHARTLLVEAADLIGAAGKPEPLGDPMEIIESIPLPPLPEVPKRVQAGTWIDPGVPDLPSVPLSKNACPKCDSRTTKIVRAGKGRISLECPVCGHIWWR